MEGTKHAGVLLDVRELTFSFRTYAGEVQAVRGVSFLLKKGRSLGLVGESGCGKSVTAKSIVRLNPEKPRGLYKRGQVLFEGRDLMALPEKEMRKVRAQDIRMIFQDPMTSLNPTMTVGRQIVEGIMKYGSKSKAEAKKTALETLALAGIPSPEDRFKQYPHEFSGGMRQRVVIAIALACNPEILICDEPTTALDVTIQAQILQLLKDLKEKHHLTTIYITHDLGVVANVADRIAVMYAGDVIEVGTCEEIFFQPKHPYTWSLLSSLPQLAAGEEELYCISGTPPNLFQTIQGDAFAPRNPWALQVDFLYRPPYFEVSPTHKAKTWLLDPRAPKIEPPAAIRRMMELGKQPQARAGRKESADAK